ncbi:MAG TPA: hypothetical protein VE974_23370 [Thermoanaerobaculia bacterium]|nr:hypothetical protein [Thermoanaerobaculia bacterium]
MIKTRCPFVLLALIVLAAPLFADSPEIQVGSTVRSPAPRGRDYLAAATDGREFFLVWYDARTPGRSTIMGTRVKRSGEVLDPLGIRITSVPAWMSAPTVVWDGAAYVVVWTEGTYYGDHQAKSEVWISRVDREGRVLAAPRRITESRTYAATTSGVYAASNGSVTVIAHRDGFHSNAVAIAVLDREGNLIRREALATASLDFHPTISVAATPTRFVVTWGTGESQLFAIALSSDGRAIGIPAEIGAGEAPVIATDGTSFTIVWQRWMPEADKVMLMSRRVEGELAQLGDVQTLASGKRIYSASLLWHGDRYEIIAGYQAGPQGEFGLLSIELRDGQKRDWLRRGEPVFPFDYPHPIAVTNGSDVLVAYGTGEGYSAEIVARMYRGSSLDPAMQQLLTWSGNAHSRPEITASASGYFAAWIENLTVYATRIDANGNSLDGRGLQIAEEAYGVRVAFDGTNYVVATNESLNITVRYISPATGATVARVHIPAQLRLSFSLAVSPEAAYVAWDAFDNRVRVTRVSPASETADLPLLVSPAEMPSEQPAIAWNGSMLLVAWNETELAPDGLPSLDTLHIRGARVSSGLSLLDPAPMIVATPRVARSLPPGPSIASNGEDWLVVSELDEQQIVARRVLRSGIVEGTSASRIGDGVAPAVTWDGTRYAVAYKAGPDGLVPEHPVLLGAVSATGALLPMRRTPVAAEVVSPPSIAGTASGDVAIIYTKVSFLPEHLGLERSYFRVMDFDQRRRAVRR